MNIQFNTNPGSMTDVAYDAGNGAGQAKEVVAAARLALERLGIGRRAMYGFGRVECWRPDGRVPVDSHTGDRHALRRRIELKAAAALQKGLRGVAEVGPHLLRWTSDSRNLRAAWDHLSRYGGAAPGPNGLLYEDLCNREIWELCRALREAIRSDGYRPGPDRLVKVPKPNGRGDRTLRLQNIEDRIVARAVVQTIQPLLDPTFDVNSFGYRPGRDRRHALATAMHLAEVEDRSVWVLEDVKNAFDNVPLPRLLNVIRRRFPSADNLWRLIERVVDNGSKRGLRQGSPLSSLLLNVYLDHFLDRVWRKRALDSPLLRSADDLLVLCRTPQEALQAREHLRRILTPAGMPLKTTTAPTAVRNLRNDKAEWLGYEVTWGNNGLEVRNTAVAWESLGEKMQRAHEAPSSPLRAVQIVRGWIEQLGPCFPHEDNAQTVNRILETGRQVAFDELPDANELMDHWRASYARWQNIHRASRTVVHSLSRLSLPSGAGDDGSADRHVFLAAEGRGDGASCGAPSPFYSPNGTVSLYTDGSCDRFTERGGWAAIFIVENTQATMKGRGKLPRTTNNRAELIAVINALAILVGPTKLRIFSDSKYVVLGIAQHISKWKAQGWRAGSGRHKRDLCNADLWRDLDKLLEPHNVTCHWVRGHTGNIWNEQCDRMARAELNR